MPDEPDQPDRGWLLEPVGPNQVRIHVEVGEGAEISPEVRDALNELVEELHASEVAGFAVPCPDLSKCGWYDCNLGRCQPQTRYPCAWEEQCAVTKFF